MMRKRKKKERPTVIPMVKLNPWQITVYSYLEWPTKRRIDKSHHITNTKDNATTYRGKLTPSSLKNLRQSIKLLIAQSVEKEALNFKTNSYFTFRVNFITLTLSAPQRQITDKELKSRLLDVWLKKAKRRFNLQTYVWRAERQLNNNIHFHLMTDIYIDHRQLRDSWNETQNSMHFINEFERRYHHRHPNSTDVHSVQKIQNLAAYICKYMTKGDRDLQPKRTDEFGNKRQFDYDWSAKKKEEWKESMKLKNLVDGKVWGSSKNLMNRKGLPLLLDGTIKEETTHILKKFADRKFDAEFATVLGFTEDEFNAALPPTLSCEWKNYLKSVRENTRKKEDPPENIINRPPTALPASLHSSKTATGFGHA
jgi:hypothetical protein